MTRRIHATEQQLGYFRRYRTRNGEALRMIRMQAQPEPIEVDPMRTVAEILAGVIVLLALWVGIMAWLLIGSLPPVPRP